MRHFLQGYLTTKISSLWDTKPSLNLWNGTDQCYISNDGMVIPNRPILDTLKKIMWVVRARDEVASNCPSLFGVLRNKWEWWNCQGHSYSNYPVLENDKQGLHQTHGQGIPWSSAPGTLLLWNMACWKILHRWFSQQSSMESLEISQVPGSLACRGCYQQFFSKTMSCWSMQHRWPWSKLAMEKKHGGHLL